MIARTLPGSLYSLRILAVAFAALLFALAGVAKSEAKPTKTALALQSSLNKVIRAPNSPPGIAGLIVRSGKRQFFRRGRGNVRSGSAPRLWLPFRIASVSKAYNGAVALSLVAHGKLRLYDTIGKLLPNLLPRARKVTLAQALQHTAGLADYIRDNEFIKKLIARPSRYMTPRRLLSFVRDDRLEFRPGTEYEYSDSDNIVVGLMAEKVTGIPYEWLMRREIARKSFMVRPDLPRRLFMPTPFLHGYEISAAQAARGCLEDDQPGAGLGLGRDDLDSAGAQPFHARLRRRPAVRSIRAPGSAALGRGFLFAARPRGQRSRSGPVPVPNPMRHDVSATPARSPVTAYSRPVRPTASARSPTWPTPRSSPGQGSPRVSALIRKSQVAAVCHALR